MSRTFHFTVDHMVGRHEIELDVTYSVTPFVPATYWQPAEGGECEIESITHNGKPFALSDAEEDALLEQAIARSHDDMAEDAADEADYRYEQMRDRQMMERWEREA
jgi:hypothetical protein